MAATQLEKLQSLCRELGWQHELVSDADSLRGCVVYCCELSVHDDASVRMRSELIRAHPPLAHRPLTAARIRLPMRIITYLASAKELIAHVAINAIMCYQLQRTGKIPRLRARFRFVKIYFLVWSASLRGNGTAATSSCRAITTALRSQRPSVASSDVLPSVVWS